MFWISAVIRATPYLIASVVYLRKLLDPPAAGTLPVPQPFDPPFLGGQCPVFYRVRVKTDITVIGNTTVTNQVVEKNVIGAIRGLVTINNGAQFARLGVKNGNGIDDIFFDSGGGRFFYFNSSVTIIGRLDGQIDNCGNIGSPFPPPQINNDGLAGGNAPDIVNNSTTVNVGSSLSPQLAIGGAISSIRGAISAAVAAANAAANTLGAIASVANAIGGIGDAIGEIAKVLDKLEDREREKEKGAEDKKDTLRYEFGSISKDGFLRLYPDVNTQKYKAEQLDLIIQSIPIGYGKYFGNKSPNFYRFKSLGYIAFVSPTFGVIEYKEIEFSRVSFIIPDDAIGFFYHLGLDGSIAANSFAFYTKGKV